MKAVSKLFFSVIFGLLLGGIATAQVSKKKEKVDVVFNQITIEEALFKLGGQINVSFTYNAKQFPLDSVITASYSSKSVSYILEDILGSNVEIIERGKHIILKVDVKKGPKKRKYTLQGRVLEDESEFPIENATVFIIGTNKSVLTSANGYYELDISTSEQFVEISFSKRDYRSEIVVIEPNDSIRINVRLSLKEIPKIPTKPIVEIATKREVEEIKIVKRVVPEESMRQSNSVLDFLEEREWQVSFLPYLGSNGAISGSVTNKLSLNVLAGYNGGVEGFELGGLLNIIKNDVSGGQIGGIANLTGGELLGIQIGGLINYNLGKVSGIQVAGLVNSTMDSVLGVQVSGIANFNLNHQFGAQMAGFSNIQTSTMEGVQMAGFGNVAWKKLDGLQLSGFFNLAKDTIQGGQLAGYINSAKTIYGPQLAGYVNLCYGKMDGAQLAGFANIATKEINGIQATSMINIANKINGVQIGLINIADSIQGVPIGLINIMGNGYVVPELSYSDINDFNFSFKSGIKHFYTILRGSYTHRTAYDRWSYGLGFGTSWDMIKNRFSFDLNNTSSVYNFDDQFNTKFNLHNQTELNLALRVWKRIELFAGPSFNFYVSEPGMAFSPDGFIPNSTKGTLGINRTDQWWGYQFGIRL